MPRPLVRPHEQRLALRIGEIHAEPGGVVGIALPLEGLAAVPGHEYARAPDAVAVSAAGPEALGILRIEEEGVRQVADRLRIVHAELGPRVAAADARPHAGLVEVGHDLVLARNRTHE